jgi:protein-tyrosine phosphatase
MAEIYVLHEFENVALAIMARPRAGDWLSEEITSWHRAGVRTVVSLLEPAEVAELGLGEEAVLCSAAGIDFLSYPIPDRGVPVSVRALNELVNPLAAKIKAGHLVAVHCRAGIGRSSLVAAAILVRAGIPYLKAFPALSKARGVTVPDTEAQVNWLQAYAQAAI